MAIFLILYAVILTLVLSLALPRLATATPRLRQFLTWSAVAGVVVFVAVLWWSLSR